MYVYMCIYIYIYIYIYPKGVDDQMVIEPPEVRKAPAPSRQLPAGMFPKRVPSGPRGTICYTRFLFLCC